MRASGGGLLPDLSNYTDNLPNDFAMRVIRALEAEGFIVATTGQGPKAGQRKTLRITWRGIYIGLVSKRLWGRKDGCDPDLLRVDSDDSGSYLWVKNEATSLLLMRDWATRIDEVFFRPTGSREAESIEIDLRTILEDKSKSETERLAEMSVRLGQGKFRADLQQELGNACAATGLTVLPALRASHIVPWKESAGEQRLAPKSGLLLSANLDALFDRYTITFRPDGKLETSNFLTQRDLERLGPMQALQSKPCDRPAAYLRRHNAEFERLEQERSAYVMASAR